MNRMDLKERHFDLTVFFLSHFLFLSSRVFFLAHFLFLSLFPCFPLFVPKCVIRSILRRERDPTWTVHQTVQITHTSLFLSLSLPFSFSHFLFLPLSLSSSRSLDEPDLPFSSLSFFIFPSLSFPSLCYVLSHFLSIHDPFLKCFKTEAIKWLIGQLLLLPPKRKSNHFILLIIRCLCDFFPLFP